MCCRLSRSVVVHKRRGAVPERRERSSPSLYPGRDRASDRARGGGRQPTREWRGVVDRGAVRRDTEGPKGKGARRWDEWEPRGGRDGGRGWRREVDRQRLRR